RDFELTLAAYFHAGNAFVPAFDHLSLSQREVKGRASYRAVEFLPRGEPAGVMHFYLAARLGLFAGAHLDVPILKSGRSLDTLPSHLRRAARGTGRAVSWLLRGGLGQERESSDKSHD